MRRRLDRNGETRLAEWLGHYKPDDETRRLITEVCILSEYAASEVQLRFYAITDFSNPGETIIEPETGLTIHVRPLDTDQFTLVRIIDARRSSTD